MFLKCRYTNLILKRSAFIMDKKLECILTKAKVEDCKEIFQKIVDMTVYEKMEDQVEVNLMQLEEYGFAPP